MTGLPLPLAQLVAALETAVAGPDAAAAAAAALARLVARDDWLPAAFARPHPDHYQQYRLHADARGRFSIVSFVWGPGQATPIHDHGVWGAVGVLRGAELSQPFAADGIAPPRPLGPPHRLGPGDVECVGPDAGDIHKVSNASDGVSVSIHIYGCDIGRQARHIYPEAGGRRAFVSGYANGEKPSFPSSPRT